MRFSSLCVGPQCQLDSSLLMSARGRGRQPRRPVWLFSEPDSAWLMEALQEPACEGLTFPSGPAVELSALFFLAGGSNPHHVQRCSGRFWHGFLNIGSLILRFLFFPPLAFNLLEKMNSRDCAG